MSTATLVGSVACGAFFALSGWNKLTNAGRHQALVAELQRLHVPAVKFNQWWVPAWELVGGCGLFATQHWFFAAVLLAIMCVALCTAGPGMVASYKPINKADWLDDWLYLPETLLSIVLLMVICG